MFKQALKVAHIIMNDQDKINTKWGLMSEWEIACLILKEVVHEIKVTIEVEKGMADVTSYPDGVEVEIIDHDIEKHQ